MQSAQSKGQSGSKVPEWNPKSDKAGIAVSWLRWNLSRCEVQFLLHTQGMEVTAGGCWPKKATWLPVGSEPGSPPRQF